MLAIIVLVLILGTLVFIHELGHFLTAKKSNVFIYEFAIGMGPRILKHTGKDGIVYSIRAFPIGGFVQMAGETIEDDKNIKKERFLCNRPWHQRIIVMLAGVFNNFVFAFLLLFLMALIWGTTTTKPIVGDVMDNYPASVSGIEAGDKIIKINNKKTSSWDKVIIELTVKNKKGYYNFTVEKKDGSIKEYKVVPKIEKDSKGNERNVIGIEANQKIYKGLDNAFSYAFSKFGSIISTMFIIIISLFTGGLSISSLSGPVGMYSIVGSSLTAGLQNIIYLTAYLSINLGFINSLPFPAFDGGRAFFLLIEKIIGRPVNQKFENTLHTIGFILLMILMVVITSKDILNLF